MAPRLQQGLLRVGASVVVAVMAGCQDDDAGGLPEAVADTRAAIMRAAESRDYDALPPLLNDDELATWRRQGPKPLETMDAVLRMPHQVRETNEGTLYQWPRLGPNSEPGDMSDTERDIFREVMPEAEVETLINPDYGYTAPRLGILADGRWWFFVTDRAP